MPEALKTEYRSTSIPFEVRETDDGKQYVEGYGIKWEQLSLELGYWERFKEKFERGAFLEYLDDRNQNTKFLVDHETGKILARTDKGTLEIKEDEIGLYYRLEIPNTTLGRDYYEDVKNGNKDGVSVGFRVSVEEWDESDPENIVRTVRKAELLEISGTGWPAYPQTTANVRSIKDAYQEFKDATEEAQESRESSEESNGQEIGQEIELEKLKLIEMEI